MERVVDSMGDAYEDFVDAATAFLQSRVASNGRRTPDSDAAMQAFKDKFERFKASCDCAEDLLLSASRVLVSDFAAAAAVGHGNDKVAESPGTAPQPSNAAESRPVPAVNDSSPPSSESSGSQQPSEDAAK